MRSLRGKTLAVLLAASAAVALVGVSGAAGQGAAAVSVAKTQTVAARRITETQYRNAIADIFAKEIEINGRFEPEVRDHRLLAIGASRATISTLGFQQYYAMGRSIATQVTSTLRRDTLIPCKPADPKAADDACTEAMIRKYAPKLFRRPVTDAEVRSRVELARQVATEDKDWYAGARLALNSLLVAPEFLFRYERAEVVGGKLRLDAWTRASRLSYLFWDTTPDDALLAAAADGSLMTDAGLKAQIARLSGSPRVEAGVRALFSDMMQLDLFESLNKNGDIYRKYSQQVAASAKEQTLRTVVDHVLTRNRDYRDLLTTRETFLDRATAAIYKVPYSAGEGWQPYTFPVEADRAGLQTQITFLSLHSHPGRSSPTKRGVALNEIFLCQETPLPPDEVDFSLVNTTDNPLLKTVRSRLLAHAIDETCAGCHNLTDPVGLSLERFDSLGQRRDRENGELIDVKAELDGVKFEGAGGLGRVLRNNPRVSACMVEVAFGYGAGRVATEAEHEGFLKRLNRSFARSGYKYMDLIKTMAASPEFYAVALPPAPAQPAAKIASDKPVQLGGL